jgi:hypothetical protein
VIKRWRHESLRRHHESRGARSVVVEGASELERLQLHHQVAGAVLELEEPFRTAVVLRYQQELSYEEIGVRLGVDPVTVRKRVSRGIARLRARLRDRLSDPSWRRTLCVFAGLERAPHTVSRLRRFVPWCAGLGGLAVASILWTRPGSGSSPGSDAGSARTCGPEALFLFGDYLGRWEPEGSAGHRVEIEWSGKAVRFRQLELIEGRETLISDALIGWHSGREQLVFHQFMFAAVEEAFEGSAWFEGDELRREYLSIAGDGSSRAWRDRWTARGADRLRRVERAAEDGEWELHIEVVMRRVSARALAGSTSPAEITATTSTPRPAQAPGAAIRGFEPFLGTWALPERPDGWALELSWGIEGRSVRMREMRFRGGRPEPLGETLVGWHPGEQSLVFHGFTWKEMHEGRVWFEPGPILVREFRAYEADGRESECRERFVPEGPNALTWHSERREDQGDWIPTETLRLERH